MLGDRARTARTRAITRPETRAVVRANTHRQGVISGPFSAIGEFASVDLGIGRPLLRYLYAIGQRGEIPSAPLLDDIDRPRIDRGDVQPVGNSSAMRRPSPDGASGTRLNRTRFESGLAMPTVGL